MMVTSFICELCICGFVLALRINLADSISHALLTSHQDKTSRLEFRAAKQRPDKMGNRYKTDEMVVKAVCRLVGQPLYFFEGKLTAQP